MLTDRVVLIGDLDFDLTEWFESLYPTRLLSQPAVDNAVDDCSLMS